MRQRIPVSDLRVGMRVVELDISWLKSPFWRHAFTIQTQNEITLLRQHCQHVEISVSTKIKGAKSAKQLPSSTQGNSTQKAVDVPQQGMSKPNASIVTHQKIAQAQQHLQQVAGKITDVFDDARTGHALDAPKLQHSVELLTQDVLTDTNSLLLLSQLQNKDQSLSEKSINVCILTLTFAKHLGIKKDQLHQLGLGALLHDIGMLRVPASLLNHKGTLNASQKAIIQQHVIDGVSMVAHHDNLADIKDMIAYHHERYDGSGYPYGLKGRAIPLFARILGITTTYEAMTRERFFSSKTTPTHALSKLYAWRHQLFDGRLVEKFIQALGVYPPGCIVQLNTGQIAIVTEINPEKRTRPVVRLLMSEDKVLLKEQPEINLIMSEYEWIKVQKILDTQELELTKLI
ncbi:HD-GYP domain-containing protein [Oceanospirillum multiglobuliferum]|uniref:HD-GYP domain-containing protein n=2 Tax=Oceanospirillum multiglobuliferum TaxID=64969 RepID=A0A1V4T0N1_9GAMM|nr:HD-GYP domain-containing protein [Oceanospirillum multiglobuliferum]OPX54086.1 hypothetical protein BTE48_16080 [Oceanospirillum multiglobuliferum]